VGQASVHGTLFPNFGAWPRCAKNANRHSSERLRLDEPFSNNRITNQVGRQSGSLWDFGIWKFHLSLAIASE